MGNYSYINESDFTNDIDKFLRKLAPYYDRTTTHWVAEEKISMLTYLPDKYRDLDDDQKLQSSLLAMGKIKFAMPELKIENDKLYIDIDSWKIQGYWYKDFNIMIELFWELGLRGYIDMTEETDQDFIIKFKKKGVEVEVFGSAEGSYDEKEDEYTITTPSREMESCSYIMKGGKLE